MPLLKKPSLDPNCLDNYRPITITTCASKMLELLILDELMSVVPQDLQFGFIPGRGSAQASLLASETVQHRRRRGLPVFTANLDARKCFGRIWHDGLFFRLVQHLSVNSWLLIVDWYHRLSAHVVLDGITSGQFCIHRGTRQGAILSPMLTNIFLCPLLRALDSSGCGATLYSKHVPAVCYADDLLLLSTNAKHLQSLLHLVECYANRWRLEFVHQQPPKTKSHCIIFGSELLGQIPSWTLSGQTLQVRPQSEHLAPRDRLGFEAVCCASCYSAYQAGARCILRPHACENAHNRLSPRDKIR